jgi:hypothetical protein
MGALTRVAVACAALVLADGCAGPLSVETLPEAKGRPLAKLALVPFEYPDAGEDSSALVTAKLLEALVQHGGFDVIPTTEVSLALRSAGFPREAKAIGSALQTSFGCDAIASGSVERYEERIGGPRGVTRPASVAFALEVRDPAGTLLWRGRYDETQEDVAGNLFTLGRARERSFEWVTAESLAGYGARGLARELRESAASWR